MTTPFDDLLPTLPEEVALAARECWEACKDSKVGDTTMSHIHHECWLERLMEPVENRIRCILLHKDPAEHVERLRRLRPFDTSKATSKWRQARAAYDIHHAQWLERLKSRAVKDKAWTAFGRNLDEAWVALNNTGLSPEMLAVHAQVCGCPWDKNKDIFGGRYIL